MRRAANAHVACSTLHVEVINLSYNNTQMTAAKQFDSPLSLLFFAVLNSCKLESNSISKLDSECTFTYTHTHTNIQKNFSQSKNVDFLVFHEFSLIFKTHS